MMAIAAVLLLLLLLAAVAYSQPPPSPSPDCFPYLLRLEDCLDYVEKGSNVTQPDPPCCAGLENLLATQPICLCRLIENTDQIGATIDLNRTVGLPDACGLTTPATSLCSDRDGGKSSISLPPSGVPAPAPTMEAAADTVVDGPVANALTVSPVSDQSSAGKSRYEGNNRHLIIIGLLVTQVLSSFFHFN